MKADHDLIFSSDDFDDIKKELKDKENRIHNLEQEINHLRNEPDAQIEDYYAQKLGIKILRDRLLQAIMHMRDASLTMMTSSKYTVEGREVYKPEIWIENPRRLQRIADEIEKDLKNL